jgi:hypothetical protein
MHEQSETLNTSSQKQMFQNSNDFSLHIETTAIDDGISCYNALLNYCYENDIDPEDIAKNVNKQLKEKLAVEFAEMGLLKKSPSLYD